MKTKQEDFKIAGAVEYKGQKLKYDELYAEPKLDGMRMKIVMYGSKGVAYTRGGCEMVNAKHVISELEARPALFHNRVLDGEAVIYDEAGKVDFNLTQSVCMTETPHPRAKDLQYRVFDVLKTGDWKLKICKDTLAHRKNTLKRLLDRLHSKRIVRVKHKAIKADILEMRSFMKRMRKLGYEGGVYKNPASFYSYRKNNDWWKLKPYTEGDFEITGVKAGKKGKTGQMLGLIGSLHVKGVVDGKAVTFHSSGMTMKLRKEMTAMHKKGKLVGLTVETKHEGLTVKNKVRFPRFQRLRLDK